jgi:energy-coupling factor transporter ATP-binding protein EcfA2
VGNDCVDGGDAPPGRPLLETVGLGFRYPSRLAPALRRLDVGVAEGETLLVLGPSGSGKSTFTLCLDGLIPHAVDGELEGTVVVTGKDTRESPVHELAQDVGLVFQDPEAQFCTVTVADEVAFGLENLLVPPADMGGRIDLALTEVGLAGFGSRRLQTLSGGEKQRVALAAVLALGSRILVLDEPTANLDPAGAAELFALIGRLAQGRRTLVVIEHCLDELMAAVDRVLVLAADGSLLFLGEPHEAFYDRGEALRTAGVWRPRVVEAVEGLRVAGWAVPGRPLTVDQAAGALLAVPHLAGRLRRAGSGPVEQGFGPESPAAGSGEGAAPEEGPLIRVRDLTFAYPGGASALEGIDLAVPRGDFLAVVGANGAGKSTLAGLVAGLLKPPPGTVFVDGRDIAATAPGAFGGRVGYVFQNPEHQFVTERVRDEIAVSLVGGRRRELSLADDATLRAWLEGFGLLALAEANPFSLSQGQKRRLSVAAVLARGHEVLILDEPTFGQDQAQTETLVGLLEGLWRDGRTIMILTHDMDLVARSARRLLVLDHGRALFLGEPRAFFAKPDLVEGARLIVPAVGRLAAMLGAPELLTVGALLAAAGAADGAPGRGGAV